MDRVNIFAVPILWSHILASGDFCLLPPVRYACRAMHPFFLCGRRKSALSWLSLGDGLEKVSRTVSELNPSTLLVRVNKLKPGLTHSTLLNSRWSKKKNQIKSTINKYSRRFIFYYYFKDIPLYTQHVMQ